MTTTSSPIKHFLVLSDFDQTLSFNDSGVVLSQLIGASSFEEKVAGLARSNLVQQGGELAYLIRHDPEFRAVRPEHLAEAGRRVRLRTTSPPSSSSWIGASRGTASPSSSSRRRPGRSSSRPSRDRARRKGFSPRSWTGTRDPGRSEPCPRSRGLRKGRGRRRAGSPARDRTRPHDLRRRRQLGRPRHAARQQPRGFTIAVSENKLLARIAKRTVLSDSAFSVVVPILERVAGWRSAEIRASSSARAEPAGLGEVPYRSHHGPGIVARPDGRRLSGAAA